MGAIVLDVNKVNSYVLPNLKNANDTVQKAYNTICSLKSSLLSSFYYKNTVNEIKDQIYNIKKEINDVNSIISKKLEQAKKIEKSNDNRAGSIATLLSQIGSFSGSTASIHTSSTISSKVINNIENKIETGATIVKDVVSGVAKLGNNIINSFNMVGAKLSSGFKSFINLAEDTTKEVGSWISDKFDSAKNWTCQALKDTGAWITNAASVTWDWIKNGENWQKVGATAANMFLGLTKGLISFVEAGVDLAFLSTSAGNTLFTGIFDIISGISTGNWEWKATKKLWDSTKARVAYDATGKISNWFYSTDAGKTLDEYAYSPFKSDGLGFEICEGIGYVAGIVVVSIFTCGAGGFAAAGTSAMSVAMGATAAAAGTAKYTAEEWNKNSVSIGYNGTNMEVSMDYEKFCEIEKLKQGESTTLIQQITLEDGTVMDMEFTITSKGNGLYDMVDNLGNVVELNSLNESNTAKGLLVGSIKGSWEGVQYYVGGQIGGGQFTKITGKIASPILKKITTSGIRVVLDTATGVVEVPFQSLVSMMSEGKSWNEAWQSSGGWKAVGTQASIASISSFGGEALDSFKLLKKSKAKKTKFPKKSKATPKIKMDDLRYKGTSSAVYAGDYLKSNLNKYRYTDTSLIEGLNTQIKQNGLYHFTTSADDILESGYIKATTENLIGVAGYLGSSYGNPKTFFFSGIPEVGAFATNLDSLPLKTQAIRIDPTDAMLDSSSLRVRNFDDGAISWDGRVNLEGMNATKEYFVLVREGDQLVYKNVSEQVFNSYEFTPEAKALTDFISKKGNIKTIKQDYYSRLSLSSSKAKVSRSSKSVVLSGKAYESIFKSDSLVSSAELTSTGTANLTSKLGDVQKFSDTTEAIKEKFCSTYDLDYYNDQNSRKIVNSIMNLIEKDEFTDESVRYLFANLDILKKQNPFLSIGYWESGSKFWGGANILAMDIRDLDISEMVLSHELGHAIYDTVEGSAKTSWQPELTVKNQEALYRARENIARNREKVITILDECSVANNSAFSETVAWYDGIRDAEVKRVSDIVDELYATQNVDELKKIVESGSKMSQVKNILTEAGLSESSIDELISDKEMVKKIAIVQNNINNQVAYCSKLNGSYEFYGDQRKMSSIIDSVTQSDESLQFTFGHNKVYWQTSGDLRAYNELLADYVSLSANGRYDTLKKLEEVCGTEIFDDIRETLSGIVVKLGG